MLVCQLLAPEKIHPATFKHCDKPFKLVDWVGKERKRHNKVPISLREVTPLMGDPPL